MQDRADRHARERSLVVLIQPTFPSRAPDFGSSPRRDDDFRKHDGGEDPPQIGLPRIAMPLERAAPLLEKEGVGGRMFPGLWSASDSSGIDRVILAVRDTPSSGWFSTEAITSTQNGLSGSSRSVVFPIYSLRLFCDASGLISYGADVKKMYLGAASYVDRLLRGANPADMPLQAPTELSWS